MEFFDVVETRRSVRKFTDEEVSPALIHKAIDAALIAPNSSNMQCWEFLWVKDHEKKQKLVKACFNQNAAKTAKELIVCVARLDTWDKHRKFLISEFERIGMTNKVVNAYYNKLIPLLYTHDPFGIIGLGKKIVFNTMGLFRAAPRGPATRTELFEVAVKSAALACENLMLAATAQGLASCPMEGFDEVRLKRACGIKGRAKVVMVLGIGYPDDGGIYHERMRVPRDWVVKEI